MSRRYFHKSRSRPGRFAAASAAEIAAYDARPEVIAEREARERIRKQEEEFKERIKRSQESEENQEA